MDLKFTFGKFLEHSALMIKIEGVSSCLLYTNIVSHDLFQDVCPVGQMVKNLDVTTRQDWINKVIGKKAFMSRYKKL